MKALSRFLAGAMGPLQAAVAENPSPKFVQVLVSLLRVGGRKSEEERKRVIRVSNELLHGNDTIVSNLTRDEDHTLVQMDACIQRANEYDFTKDVERKWMYEILIDNRVVGLCRMEGDTIEHFLIFEPLRGRGFGKDFVKFLEYTSTPRGDGFCLLHITGPAVGFYEKLGYHKLALIERETTDDWIVIKHLETVPVCPLNVKLRKSEKATGLWIKAMCERH